MLCSRGKADMDMWEATRVCTWEVTLQRRFAMFRETGVHVRAPSRRDFTDVPERWPFARSPGGTEQNRRVDHDVEGHGAGAQPAGVPHLAQEVGAGLAVLQQLEHRGEQPVPQVPAVGAVVRAGLVASGARARGALDLQRVCVWGGGGWGWGWGGRGGGGRPGQSVSCLLAAHVPARLLRLREGGAAAATCSWVPGPASRLTEPPSSR